jgi:hypothetical protein
VVPGKRKIPHLIGKWKEVFLLLYTSSIWIFTFIVDKTRVCIIISIIKTPVNGSFKDINLPIKLEIYKCTNEIFS